jgi:hypothetical protein
LQQRKEAISMKYIIALATGLMLVLALGTAYAADSTTQYRGDKMIRNDDLNQQTLDENRATVNQMPAEPEVQGSGAGGTSSELDTRPTDKDLNAAPADNLKEEPAIEKKDTENNDMESPSRDSGGYRYKY